MGFVLQESRVHSAADVITFKVYICACAVESESGNLRLDFAPPLGALSFFKSRHILANNRYKMDTATSSQSATATTGTQEQFPYTCIGCSLAFSDAQFQREHYQVSLSQVNSL